MNTYLGPKGYSILKDEIDINLQNQVRRDLSISPYTPPTSMKKPETIQIFRESPKKLYVPRFYGINKFGKYKRETICKGKDINITFNGDLRDFQKNIISKYLENLNKHYGCGLLDIPCGSGKCLGKNTEIIMYDGSIKKVQDIVVGDLLMGDDSTKRIVYSITRGREKMYKIHQSYGEPYIVNESHILSLKYFKNINCSKNKDTNNNINKDFIKLDVSLKDFYNYYNSNEYNEVFNPYFGYHVSVNFDKKNINFDPYIYGKTIIQKLKLKSITKITNYIKINSRNIQLQFLEGFIDYYGIPQHNKNIYKICILHYFENNKLKYFNIITEFIKDILFIARCVGFYAIYKNNELIINTSKTINNEHNSILRIEPLEEDDYYGFTIDGNHRFLLSDFTVTHNTVMGLYIISKLSKKTLVIVHKEFLMNQWIERIQQFLPTAKIGKIQGTKIDIDNKDIVIGMLQSLSMKDYPQTLFNEFGFTIVDECHHIAAEVFCRSLFKIVTPYMLGLSATMKRKDGMTKVFKLFLGNVIHKEKRNEKHNVEIRVIQYDYDKDKDFCETIYNFKGQTHYALMIRKLCEFNHRTELILTIIKQIINEKKQKQIMVIAHNKSILKFLHDTIEERKIGSVGYYIGGMKEEALKKTETKQIVIATYAMAEEALDIKSLDTLVMCTPKTDVTQTVGRILRIKHPRALVIDIVDIHEIFQKQFKKRQQFYIKEKYKMIEMKWKNIENLLKQNKSIIDENEDKNWNIIFEPSNNEDKNIKQIKTLERNNKNSENKLLQNKCLIDLSKLI